MVIERTYDYGVFAENQVILWQTDIWRDFRAIKAYIKSFAACENALCTGSCVR